MRGKQRALQKWRRSQAYKSLVSPKLTDTEQQVFDELRAEGWQVLRNGWPDFLAVRGDEIRFIEVKSGMNSLTTEQRRVHRALRRFGIEVELVRRMGRSPRQEGREEEGVGPGAPSLRSVASRGSH